jgi:cell division protein FtsW
MRFLMFRDYHDWQNQRVAFGLAAAVILLLVVTLFVGSGPFGTKRFLRLGILSLQGSELAKLALVVFLAYMVEVWGEKLGQLRALAGAGLVLGILAALIYGGKDLGAVIMIGIIAGAILFAAGLNLAYFAAGIAATLPFFAYAIHSQPYRWDRLVSFWNPEADPLKTGFQIIQSKIAVGSGGLFGQGLMLGRQKMRFLPEGHTDFIFAVIGEELGFAGCVFVVLLFGVILWRGLRTAMRAPDDFGRYLAIGLTAMIVCQAMVNMGVVLQLLPTKGMTLPFISYGGSSLIAMLAGAGLLLNVSQRAE